MQRRRRDTAEMLLDGEPREGVIASNQMSLVVLEWARERGLAVRDVSLVSFDNTPIAAVTAWAVELIIAERAERGVPAGPVEMPSGLTIRGSTAAPRG